VSEPGNALAKTLVLVPLMLFGAAGWFLYRNPVQILDFLFGEYPGQWRPIKFFKVFGIVTMCLAALSAAMLLISTVLGAMG